MITLALETATTAAAVAVLDDDVVLAEAVASVDRHHTESLLPCAAELLGSLGLGVGEVERIVVDVGPGLFTGLRVGLATARSLAAARGIGLIGLTSLEILAADPLVEAEARVTAVVDARRGEVFAQRFVLGGPRPVPDGEPVVVSPEALAGRLADGDVLVGDGAERHAEMLRGAGARIVGLILPAPGVARPRAAGRAQWPSKGRSRASVGAAAPALPPPMLPAPPTAAVHMSAPRRRARAQVALHAREWCRWDAAGRASGGG